MACIAAIVSSSGGRARIGSRAEMLLNEIDKLREHGHSGLNPAVVKPSLDRLRFLSAAIPSRTLQSSQLQSGNTRTSANSEIGASIFR